MTTAHHCTHSRRRRRRRRRAAPGWRGAAQRLPRSSRRPCARAARCAPRTWSETPCQSRPP
eukprot:4124340-Prymnesium_polylepis.1